jgi:hypothetical protein
MFFLLISFELIELVQGIQTSLNYLLLSCIKKLLLFLEAEYFSESFGFLLAKPLPLGLDTLLLGYLGHTIDITDITGLALLNIFGITSILFLARGNISFLVLFIARTRSYIKFSCSINHFTKSEIILINRRFFWYNKKRKKL